MSDYDPMTQLPCPPLIGDYEAIVGVIGGNPVTPVEVELNTFYRSELIYFDGSGTVASVVFKCTLTAGVAYRIGCENDFTQDEFDTLNIELFYWNPSDWPGNTDDRFGATYNDTNAEDAGEKWCPYPSKLNEFGGNGWVGGRRYEFTPIETGEHVFMFHNEPEE